MLTLLDKENFQFPDPSLALTEPNGLLAIGGDLSAKRLLHAYQQGIFPWYNSGEPILWWSPDPRGVLFLEKLKISHSLKKTLQKNSFTITVNQAFNQVITACAQPRKNSHTSWITPEMQLAYINLHKLGYAYSVEVWQNKNLVGGLYGILLDNIFCGESMFSTIKDASKVALVKWAEELHKRNIRIIDCQLLNSHLERLGAEAIPRAQFMKFLKD